MAQARNKKKRRRSSRKRRASGPRPAVDPAAPKVASRPTSGAGVPSLKARREEAPKPIWAPVPVTEILILVGLIVAGVGAVSTNPPTVAGGLVMVMAASVELAVREHAAGYRSHSSLLAGIAALVVAFGGGFGLHALGVDVPSWAMLIAAVIVFAAAFFRLRRAFRRRTGGLSFRV